MKAARAGLLALAPLLMAQQSGVSLEIPNPVGWDEPADPARVAEAVAGALARRGWQLESDSGDAIVARYAPRDAWLRIGIDYGPRGLRYRYVDSGDFGYAEHAGQRTIHRRANKVLRRLDDAVRVGLEGLHAPREPTGIVPVAPGTAEATPDRAEDLDTSVPEQ